MCDPRTVIEYGSVAGVREFQKYAPLPLAVPPSVLMKSACGAESSVEWSREQRFVEAAAGDVSCITFFFFCDEWGGDPITRMQLLLIIVILLVVIWSPIAESHCPPRTHMQRR